MPKAWRKKQLSVYVWGAFSEGLKAADHEGKPTENTPLTCSHFTAKSESETYGLTAGDLRRNPATNYRL